MFAIFIFMPVSALHAFSGCGNSDDGDGGDGDGGHGG